MGGIEIAALAIGWGAAQLLFTGFEILYELFKDWLRSHRKYENIGDLNYTQIIRSSFRIYEE